MQLFENPVDIIKATRVNLISNGTWYQTETTNNKNVVNNPGYQTVELTGYGYTLTGWYDKELRDMLRYIGADRVKIGWAYEELNERLNLTIINKNPGSAWKLRRDAFEPFLRDGLFNYTPAERWQAQLPYIIHELKNRPSTRQAVMTVYDTCRDRQNWGGRDRVPGSLAYQFVIRNNKLHLIYTQRSCDFITFFPYDIFFATGLLKHVSKQVNVASGNFTHFIGSLHAYKKDIKS